MVDDKFDYYILKKNYQSFGYEDVKNHEGEIIAKVLFPLHHPYNFVELQDLKSKSTFFLQQSQNFSYKKYNLNISSGNVLAIIKVGKLPFLRNKAYLKTNKDSKKYTAIGNLKKWTYSIINSLDNDVIAQVFDLKDSDLILEGIYENTKYYCIKKNDPNEDPINLISFAISINNLSQYGVSNIAGIERRIARLRPFGPGKIK